MLTYILNTNTIIIMNLAHHKESVCSSYALNIQYIYVKRQHIHNMMFIREQIDRCICTKKICVFCVNLYLVCVCMCDKYFLAEIHKVLKRDRCADK